MWRKEFLSAAVKITVNLDFWCSYKSKNIGEKLLVYTNTVDSVFRALWLATQ